MAEKNMLKIVQKMQEQGESDEKIISTLTELGLNRKEANELIDASEVKTVSMEKAEVGRLAKEQFESHLPELQQVIIQETEKSRQILKERLEVELLNKLREHKQHTEESLQLANKVMQGMEEKMTLLGSELGQVEKQVQKLEFSGFGEKNAWVKLVLIAGGVIFSLSALALFFFSFSNLEIETLILTAIIALTGITMFFGSSLI